MKKLKSVSINGYEISMFETYDGEYCVKTSKDNVEVYTSGLFKDFINANVLFDRSLTQVITLDKKEMH